MFSPTSRYADAGTITAPTARGKEVTATQLPLRPRPPLRTVHSRLQEQRLDHIAWHYLSDPTAFWKLCDAADSIAPDALAARDEVPVPARDGGR
jgi:hypothetical protein